MTVSVALASSPAHGRRIAARLQALRTQLARDVPRRTLDETLLLATWNLREFDAPSFGVRSDECLLYIAEIVSRFDVVALQEVCEDTTALDRLRARLGPWWQALLTDVSEGVAGHRERMAFLYDSRKVQFSGLAGEIVLPPVRVKSRAATANGTQTYRPADQLARTPFVCGFQVGWSKFQLCTVHVYYGEGRSDRRRVKKIDLLARFLAKRAREGWNKQEPLILLGDFNIFAPEDATFRALTKHGFVVPEAIHKLSSNAAQNKHYDQIAFYGGGPRGGGKAFEATGRAGVFDYYESVYRDEDERVYRNAMGAAYRRAANPTAYYRTRWRTYQMSDHLPMWVELRVDGGPQP